MPYKYYYGKTGRVWNVTKRALGIEMLKTRQQKAEYKQAKQGEANYVSLKRQPEGPKCGYVLKK